MNRAIFAAALASLFWVASLNAQGYPSKPVRVIVPVPPGGGYDIVGRIVVDKLTAEMGQPIIVENRAGAGTTVGTNYVAKAPADGYTLVIGGIGSIALAPALQKDLPFNPATDLTAVFVMTANSYTLLTRPEFEAKTLQDVINFAKANPGKLTIGSLGLSSGQGVLAALVKSLAGIDILEVQYKGGQQVYPDLMSGRVDLFFDSSTAARPFLGSGKVRGLAVSSGERDPLLPDVPAAREAGLPGLAFENWLGLFAPARTPRPIIVHVRERVAKAMQSPDLQKRLSDLGVRRAAVSDPEAFVKAEIDKWPPLLRKAGLRPN